MYVCTPPLMCMWWVGWLYLPPCHLVAPTGFASEQVWVTLRQFAPHCLIFFFSKTLFFTGSASAYGLTTSCCCFHHYCCFFSLYLWLYLTALNCCSPGCFLKVLLHFWSVSVGWILWERCQPLKTLWSNHPDKTSPSFCCAYLKTKGGDIFFFKKSKV